MTANNDIPRAASSIYKHGFDESYDFTAEQKERVRKGQSPYRRDTKIGEYMVSKGKFV